LRILIIGLTGASGIRYGLKLASETSLLRKKYSRIYIVYTDSARIVAEQEEHMDLVGRLRSLGGIDGIYYCKDWSSPLSSSSRLTGADMVIVPASLNTIAKLAAGIQDNVLLRAAASILRLRGRLVVVVRETPLSTIDLWNLYRLSLAGAIVMPASPGMYIEPRSIDDLVSFITGKILDALGVENNLYRRWREDSTGST
jgi:4-hydroxy-3-polyprenylbenzoate decarboxylase